MTSTAASSGDYVAMVPKTIRRPGKDETLGEYMGMTEHAVKKLDIACGQRKLPGFTGIDLAGDADIKHDLWEFPWPIQGNNVNEINCEHFVEHIPHWRPTWDEDGWWMFWREIARITRNKAKIRIVHPYVMNGRAFWDPTHTRYIHETTWYYLDKGWREANQIDHYGAVGIDFEIVTINGGGIPDSIMTRNHEQQAFARNHYWNVITDLEVILKKRGTGW